MHLVKDLNKEIRRGYRSNFVEKAIEQKLKNQQTFDLHDINTLRLVNHLRLFRYSELTKLEMTMLEDIIARIEGDRQ